MLATLVALAVAEHWFLVAPLHANALWSWRGDGADRGVGGCGAREGDPDALARRRRDCGSRVLEPRSSRRYCDTRTLHTSSSLIATGAYGEVDWVQGRRERQAEALDRFRGRAGQWRAYCPSRRNGWQEPLVGSDGPEFRSRAVAGGVRRLRGVGARLAGRILSRVVEMQHGRRELATTRPISKARSREVEGREALSRIRRSRARCGPVSDRALAA